MTDADANPVDELDEEGDLKWTFPMRGILPKGWTFMTGLRFPLWVNWKGKDIRFDTYEEYHEFIYFQFVISNRKHRSLSLNN